MDKSSIKIYLIDMAQSWKIITYMNMPPKTITFN